jgi:SAM-dependent methyltransferase
MCRRNLTIFFALVILTVGMAALPMAKAQEYEPSIGQAGKDVIWVPTPPELIKDMLDMADVTPNDYLVDLGSGDGRIVIAAAKRGARALGIEYNPDMVELSKRNAQKEGVSDKATFMQADIFETDFSKATVLTMYLLPSLNLKLMPTVLKMKPGTRVISHAFTMGDWEPDQTKSEDSRSAYFWIVPANAEGTWSWQTPSGKAELKIAQTYQKIEGTLAIDGSNQPIKNGMLKGDRISFSIGEGNPVQREYSGLISNNTITGWVKPSNGSETKWVAERRAAGQ